MKPNSITYNFIIFILSLVIVCINGCQIEETIPNKYPCRGIRTVLDASGNTYHTIDIGTQCWMKENLKTTKYSNGTPIPNVIIHNEWKTLTTGAYVWYGNDISWKDSYGALYNWYAVDDTNSLCPKGWHVPTHKEWAVMIDFIGGTGSPHGDELKSCKQVNSPLGGNCNTSEHPRWNESPNHGTDDYGFSGTPGGGRTEEGFDSLGFNGIWWSSTEDSLGNAWLRFLRFFSGMVNESSSIKLRGNSVRCLKD